MKIIIKNGTIIDGTGNPWFKGDVGIKGERIGIVGDLTGFKADREIDAKGLIVCPGFIDIHTHSDTSFFVNPKADSKITQGVTTEIVGNCGSSAAPLTELGKNFFAFGDRAKGIDWNWVTVKEYLNRLESNGLPLNVGTLIGHGTIRANILGVEARDPTTLELKSMKALVENGMKDGAFGLSSGLKYSPGCYSETDEIVELCKVVNQYGGLYVTHLRNQASFLIEAVDEALEIGRRSGVAVQISHLKVKGRSNWGKGRNMLRIIDKARYSGLDVTFDQYPYTELGQSASIPAWALEGKGTESILKRLKDPEQRKKIEAEIPEHEDWIGPKNTIIADFSPDRSYEGKTLEEVSKLRNKSPESVICDLLIETDYKLKLIMKGWEEEVREIMIHPAMMVGSDGNSLATYGVLGENKPHPRSYGCYPRFIGKYVVREGLLSLEDGIRRATSFPASRFGLTDRGILRTNMAADLVVLDPKKIIDIASFNDPHQYSKGIEYVLVNGTVAVQKGIFTGQLTGKTLRHVARAR